jgi:hypothetical protein
VRNEIVRQQPRFDGQIVAALDVARLRGGSRLVDVVSNLFCDRGLIGVELASAGLLEIVFRCGKKLFRYLNLLRRNISGNGRRQLNLGLGRTSIPHYNFLWLAS